MIYVPIGDLKLDPQNPRLPEELHGAGASEHFGFLLNNGVLDELAGSMLDNGFFSHEPLIVLPPEEDGKRTVVEGNRRLAALMLIHSIYAPAHQYLLEQPTREHLAALAEIPVVEVATRDEVRHFLGYRHISGLKPWKPEAKARYIAAEIERVVAGGEPDPFLLVARQVGSNTVGVRNSYLALRILRTARAQCGIDVGYVVRERFGVWLRCMNSAEIRDYIGVGSPRSYTEIAAAMERLNCETAQEVIGDMTPRRQREKPVLSDSRDVTIYGQILQHQQAHEILRKYEDISIAQQVVVRDTVPDRLIQEKRRIDALRDEIDASLEIATIDVIAAADDLLRSAKLLQASVSALAEDA